MARYYGYQVTPKWVRLIFSLPFLELIGFILVASLIGFWLTLLLLFFTTFLGMTVLQYAGKLAVLRQIHRPDGNAWQTNATTDGLLMFAGILLLIPGFITDTFGLLLLLSPVRQYLLKRLGSNPTAQEKSRTHTIEGEYWREDDN